MKKKATTKTTTPATEIANTALLVTACQVYPLRKPVGKTRAIARVVLSDSLQLTGLRIVDGANGLFLAYPNDPGYKGEDYKSLFYPLTRELREHIEQTVLLEYQRNIAA